jgi:hypothetical protein
MRTTVVVLLTCVVLFWVYNSILVWTIGYALALPQPSQWSELFPSRLSGVLAWMQLAHTAAIVVASVPFAFLIAHFYGRRAAGLALLITVLTFALFSLPSLVAYFATYTPRMRVITVFDNLKLLFVLPALVWLMRRLPSNNRWGGP